jgi:hypothetical protein
MEEGITKDSYGRVTSIKTPLAEGGFLIRSVVYRSTEGSEVSSYKIESQNAQNDISTEIYDSEGRLVEDLRFLDGNIPAERHTYSKRSDAMVEVGIYTGKDGHFQKVNYTTMKGKELKTINPSVDFEDFKIGAKETALERVEREAEAEGKTPAELYARDSSLSDRPAPKVVVSQPVGADQILPEAKFDKKGRAQFEFDEEARGNPETPGMGTY